MNIEQYYVSLRKQFNHKRDNETFPILMEELAEVLNCTRRNAQLILKKMMELEYVKWFPGKGRGNCSQLMFIKPLNHIILERAKQLTSEERLDEAWKLINQLQGLNIEFTEWLYRHFGFQHNEKKDVLRFPFYRPVLDLDPTFVNRRTEAHLIEQIFNRLVEFDEKAKQIQPSLAHHWEWNEPFTEWTFYLRKGIRFHHGKLMNSEDVQFTFERIISESGFEDLKRTLKRIEIVNAYTITFFLNESNVLFLHYLCSDKCSIIPSDLMEIEHRQSFAKVPIGTGPFWIKKNNESILHLEANDYYFQGRPHLDAIEMWIWPNFDRSKVVERLEQQDIYFGDGHIVDDSHTTIHNIEQGATYLTFNSRKKMDASFRKAVHYAINREKMINELGENRLKPSCSFFPVQSEVHFQNEFSIEKASEYLEKSTYKGEKLHLYTYEMESNQRNAEWIQNELKTIGINISITILPVKELANKEVLEQADMIVAGEVLGVQPDVSLIEMYTYANGYLFNHLDNEQALFVESTISSCKQEENYDKRMLLLLSLEERLKEDFNPLFLYHTKQTIQHNGAVHGIMLNAWGKVDYKNIWVKGGNH